MAWLFSGQHWLLWRCVLLYTRALPWSSSCSQLPGAWLTAAGTPLLQGRPGRGNCLVVGPVARITWGGSSPMSHSKSDGPRINLTQFQPGTPGRFLGGNALSDSFPDFSSLRNRAQRSASTLPGWQATVRPWKKNQIYDTWLPGEELTSSLGLFCCAPLP